MDKKRLLLPKQYRPLSPDPLIFLCGPLHAAPRWQQAAAEMIFRKTEDTVIISPRWIMMGSIPSDYFNNCNYTFTRQRAWERYYLEKASLYGSILFWLPAVDPNMNNAELTYGATTRFELGEWMTRASLDPEINIEIGSDNQFDTIHTIKYDMRRLLPNHVLHNSLESLVDASIEKAHRKFASSQFVDDHIEDIVDLIPNT